MTTLKDILELTPFVTLLELDVRQPDGRLLYHAVIGKDYEVSTHQRYDESKGKFKYLDIDINKHGRADRRGYSETAYDIDWKTIPKQYLDMEVDLIHSLRDRYRGDGLQLRATVIPRQMSLESMAEE